MSPFTLKFESSDRLLLNSQLNIDKLTGHVDITKKVTRSPPLYKPIVKRNGNN